MNWLAILVLTSLSGELARGIDFNHEGFNHAFGFLGVLLAYGPLAGCQGIRRDPYLRIPPKVHFRVPRVSPPILGGDRILRRDRGGPNSYKMRGMLYNSIGNEMPKCLVQHRGYHHSHFGPGTPVFAW